MVGGPYNIPRNTKGEGRFLYVFSTKALVVTIALAIIGFGFFYVLGYMLNIVFIKVSPTSMGIIAALIFGLIGFVITTFKIPDSNNFELTRKAGGEYIDKIIIRYIKFKMNKNKIYTFYTEEKKND